MHRDRRNRVRHPGAQGDDAGDVRGVGGLGHAAEDDLLDGGRVQARLGEQFGDGDAAEFDGVGFRERGGHLGKGRADAVNDVDGLIGVHGRALEKGRGRRGSFVN